MKYSFEREIEIRNAYHFLRVNDNKIPSDTLQFILGASLEKLNDIHNGDIVVLDGEKAVEVVNRSSKILVKYRSTTSLGEKVEWVEWVEKSRLKKHNF